MKISIGAGIVLQLILGLLFVYSLTHDGPVKQSLWLLTGAVLGYFFTLMMASLHRFMRINLNDKSENSPL